MVKKKELGSTLSMVHGKKKEIICHDMRKYVWQQNEQISKRNKKKKAPVAQLDRALDYGSGG